MGSDWIYYTTIKPNRKYVTDINNIDYNNEFNKAFDIFFKQCIVSNEKLEKQSIVYIDCSGENNIIVKDNNYHISFLKSKFLLNKKLKNKLIEYYNPLGYYVKGPIQMSEAIWMLEFKRNYY